MGVDALPQPPSGEPSTGRLCPRWVVLGLAVVAPILAAVCLGRLRLAAAIAVWQLAGTVALWRGLGGLLAVPAVGIAVAATSAGITLALIVTTLRTAGSAPRTRPWTVAGFAAAGLALLVTAAPILLFDVAGRPKAVQSFVVSGGALQPNLLPGDRLLADMRAYAVDAPALGDLVVFASPDGAVGIARVVGLPGQRIALRDGIPEIDGRLLPVLSQTAVPAAPAGADDLFADSERTRIAFRREIALPDGRIWTSALRNAPYLRNVAAVTLGPTEHYLLRDDLDRSVDSRTFGPVLREAILGRVAWTYWSSDWHRIGRIVP